MNFDDVLSSLLERCPDATGAAIVDADGIAVSIAPEGGVPEAVCVEFAAILGEVTSAGREFQHGELRQLSVTAENAAVMVTMLAAGYFLLLLQRSGALLGRGRFLSRLVAERIHSEFV